MPDISLESFCSYMEEIGFVDIDLLSDFLESYNNYKKKPLQEALFITMIKFFRDNYIHNEDNLNRLCKRLIESYNKSIALKKAESIKKLTLIINNKQNTFKSVFFAKLKSRNQIENIMRRYVKGYSRDRIRKRKMSRSNSNLCSPQRDLSETQSCNNYSYSNYSNNNINMRSTNRNMNSKDRSLNNYNTITSSVYNNTSGSNLRSNFYNTEKSMKRNNSKTSFSNKKNFTRGDELKENNSTTNVFKRLNSNSKISGKKSLNNSINNCITSQELKEMKEYEECTFQPRINYYYPSCNNTNSRNYTTITANTEEDNYENVHEKLFREQVKIKEKKNIKSLENMISESKVLTFQPYINPVSKILAQKSRSRSFNKMLNKSVDYQDINKSNGEEGNIFLKNMEKHKQVSEKNKMANYMKRQKELSREYTYSPRINKNYKSQNSESSQNQFNNNYGSYDFSYLNQNIINSKSPKKDEAKLPVFSRVTGYNSNSGNYQDYSLKSPERKSSNLKRSRSKSKARNKSHNSRNKSNIKSRKDIPNFQQVKSSNQFSKKRIQDKNTNTNLTFNKNNFQKKTNYYQEELFENDALDVSDIPMNRRPHSSNNLGKGKPINQRGEEAKENYRNRGIENLNLILKENLNKNRNDNNDYHFNYNFKNEYLSSAEGNSNLYLQTDQNKSGSKEIFDKLHDEAEKLKIKKMILSNEMYSEKYGITFHPKINQNPKYSVNTDFHSRDMNFVKSKREKIERLMREEKEKEFSTIRKSRTLSKEEKDRNTKGVVERLYKKQMEKLKETQAKKLEEEKNAEAEAKKRRKSKEEIEINNKNIVQRLYSTHIEKIKEHINVSKKLNKEEYQKNIDMIENENLNKIKQSNKKKYSTVQSRVFTASAKNNTLNNNLGISPSKDRNSSKNQNENLLKKLKKEHKIKFKNEDLSSVSKSKEKTFNRLQEKAAHETRIKKTEDSSPNKNSLIQDNTKNAFNFMDSINTNTNRNSLLQSNSSVGDKLKKSNSKIVKPLKSTDLHKKNYSNNSDYLLESNNIHFKKSNSGNSNDKNYNSNNNFDSVSNINNNNKNLNKKNSLIKDYANFSPINNENTHSLLEMNALSNKSSFRDEEGVNPNLNSKLDSSLNSKNNNYANNATTFNNSNTKETSFTHNSRNLNYEMNNVKESNDNNLAGLSDNSNNSRGIDVKENKFKSKGLEKILSGRK